MEKIIIENFGPVSYFEAEVKDVMIFIGPQASGKSTIAKLIFFFKSIKDVILRVISDYDVQLQSQSPIDLIAIFKTYLSGKFLSLFGNISNTLPFTIKYYYSNDKFIKVILPKVGSVLEFICSETITTQLNQIFIDIKKHKKEYQEEINNPYLTLEESLNLVSLEYFFVTKTIEKFIHNLLKNNKQSIFIPAGRILLSVLNEQLINLNLESESLDFLTKTFIKTIQTLKSFFKDDLEYQIQVKKKFKNYNNNFEKAELAIELIKKILKGNYKLTAKDERLYFNNEDYVKLNYASSGQQEALWIVLLIFKYILDEENVFTVVEESEAHLYPESQNEMVKLMALLANVNQNQIIITTHSPYILSAFNNLLYAHQIGQDKPDEVAKLVNPKLWLDINRTSAYFIGEGSYESIIDPELNLIQAEKIDSASRIINETFDKLFDLDD